MLFKLCVIIPGWGESPGETETFEGQGTARQALRERLNYWRQVGCKVTERRVSPGRVDFHLVNSSGDPMVVRLEGPSTVYIVREAKIALSRKAEVPADVLRDLTAFVFSEVNYRRGYRAALGDLCKLKRRAARVLADLEVLA